MKAVRSLALAALVGEYLPKQSMIIAHRLFRV